MDRFKALRVSKAEAVQTVAWENIGLDDLSEGDVVGAMAGSW